MKSIQKISILCVVFTLANGNARNVGENEINNETIKTILSNDVHIKPALSDEFVLSQKTTSFDFSKINSSAERPMLNIDIIYDQIEALERHLAGVSAQVQALKGQVREARHVAQEQAMAEKNQTKNLLSQLQETREKLNQTQQLLAAADQQKHQLETQVAQLTQAEKPAVAEVLIAVPDNQETPEIQTPLA